MADWQESLREHRRLCERSRAIRADAIRTRILTVHAFCSVAESQIQRQSSQEARSSLEKIHHAVAEIDFHLREPGHVSSAAAHALREELTRLEIRIRHVEKEKRIGKLSENPPA
jgi:hypothetical protein